MHNEKPNDTGSLPDPDKIYPRSGDMTVCYLKNVIKSPNISIGDFTMYHDFDDPTKFEQSNVLYQYPANNDKLIVGKFCSIACGTKFIMNGANHKLGSFTNYPFPVFAEDWGLEIDVAETWDNKGDIVVGNDVWFGFDSIVQAGVTIGDGAVIATRSIVTADVPPYTIVGGSPARIIRKRFDDRVIEILQRIEWWNWDIRKIKDNITAIHGGDISLLEGLHRENRI